MIYDVQSIRLEATCVGISMRLWEHYMKDAVKANGYEIKKLIKKHLPELAESLGLKYHNPYESNCKRTKTHFIYVHSNIEYFLKFKR
tara:strand:+ start:32769 stop:33029 length:261 start_codon:yes stop_codon:yes gene_type:complete